MNTSLQVEAMTVKVNLLTLTATELQELLTEGAITSTRIVELYLDQIAKHNHNGFKLNAILATPDRPSVLRRAQRLDDERAQGRIRGPLHGVPIILKQGSPKVDANLIGTLNDAGLIIIAKANLSVSPDSTWVFESLIFEILTGRQELGNSKGDRLMAGWSAVGGQTKNPHVEGDIPADAPFLTSWGPAGSSSGSATAVAAGFSPISLGTELEGSIIWPAARAGLYAVKLTPGSVDQTGFQPGATGFDCQGPYGKTTADVAILSAILQLHDPSHYLPLPNSWDGLKVGVVDPTLWRTPSHVVEDIEGFLAQTDSALHAAEEKIQEFGGKVVKSVPLDTWGKISSSMPDLDDMGDLFTYQMKVLWPDFLALWDGIPQTIEELIEWNEAHADLEFTARNNNQKAIEAMRDCTMTEDEYERNASALRKAARAAVQRVLEDYGVDLILAPSDSRLISVGAAAGYPVGNLPLGYADFNGRGFSLHAIAPAGEEKKILQVMAAWEATFPDNVRPPRMLAED
ncbi:hypothetical protein AK830_g9002 [Neonectria ditissima]|uniref:Amidase domain-containing protein n=1 Tax=Neonectria ditissima TaxID=78410 RepID=A0A0P7BB08_9HYPO|nr:hypothetical protein AK830_g9002 [Neonectria ditissima]